LCEEDAADSQNKYVMIIDEINRGNISKIFGELITLLEKDKRGTHVILPYSKKSFTVPENIYIIGTMNTADRSLVYIDAALKRRFAHYELMPNPEILDKTIGRIHLGNLLSAINRRILEAGLRENQIGHSYFMENEAPINNIEDLKFAFAYDIIPLLKDHFYDDDKTLQKVLGGQFIDEDRNILTEWIDDSTKFEESLKKAYPEAIVQ